MADKKISELVSLAGKDVAATDFFPVVDVSVAETKSLTRDELRNAVNAIQFAATKALATTAAASLPDDTIIEVAADESLSGARTRYAVAAGALVFDYGVVTKADLADTSDPAKGAALVGFQPAGAGALASSVQEKLREFVSVKDFGAVGDGVTDDTAAFIAAFAYANGLVRTGLSVSIRHPGCTVVIPRGTYNLASIASELVVLCSVRAESAAVIVPAAYAGTVFRVGYNTSGDVLATADVKLPDVYKPTGSAIIGNSVGVRLCNINASNISLGRISYFDYGTHWGGIGEGTVYNKIYLGQIFYCNRLINIVPGSAGWCNSNTVIGGNLRQGGNRVAGQHHIYMDGTAPATAIVGNNFNGTALEGNGSTYVVYAKTAYGNKFNGIYHETGVTGVAVTVSGATLTKVAHGLVVGDMVAFAATVLPTGMFDLTPYYVTATPTADTFEVSTAKGGASVTFSSYGTSVIYYLQARSYFDGSTLTYSNTFSNLFAPPSVLMDFIQSGTGAYNNGVQGTSGYTLRPFAPNDFPMFRGGNSSFAPTTRAIFAAYPQAVDPFIDPIGWTAALSDRGLLFAASRAETGRLWNAAGQLQYTPAGQANASIPSGFRSASLTTLGTTVVAGGTRNLQTITVTGAAVGDYVTPVTNSALPDGIAIAWARVSAANTVQICFYNWTAGNIDLAGTQLKAMVSRSFY